jgi:toxin YoeB
MKIVWSEIAWEEYLYWQENNIDILMKINVLIKQIKRTPFIGIGKPEPLKANLKGWWSRRITGQHRLVYRAQGKGDEQKVEIIQCRFHY